MSTIFPLEFQLNDAPFGVGHSGKKNKLENVGKSSTIKSDILIHRSVGAKAKKYDIELPDGSGTHLTEGTRIEKVQVIAGKGRDRKN